MLTRFYKALTNLFYRMGSPLHFYGYAQRIAPVTGFGAIILMCIGLVWGISIAPADYQQGDAFRIIYLHVPAAALSMGVYVYMAVLCVIALIWKIKLCFMLARSCAMIGAIFTVIALFTGAVWGKPMWGTYWVWDARLTSELILLFLYLGYMGLQQSIDNADIADKSSSILAIVGVINIPIIHYSVYWWQTLHQGSTLFKFDKPSIASEMLWPLIIMLIAFFLIFLTYVLISTRTQILSRRINEHLIREQRRG